MEVDGRTRLFGVIGDPIRQIKTPGAINPVFSKMGVNVLCLPIHVNVGELDSAWVVFRKMRNLVGLGITLPHKNTVLNLCDYLEPAAKQIGAVNCVRRGADGSMIGAQFDGIGFIQGLLDQGHDPRGKQVLLVGAGGAAQAIAFALVDSGVSRLVVANRTEKRAVAIQSMLGHYDGGVEVEIGSADPSGFDLVVNATSLGLRPEDPLPLDVNRLEQGTLVAEVVASPQETTLLKKARERGCVTQSGMHMIHGQVRLIASYVSRS